MRAFLYQNHSSLAGPTSTAQIGRRQRQLLLWQLQFQVQRAGAFLRLWIRRHFLTPTGLTAVRQ